MAAARIRAAAAPAQAPAISPALVAAAQARASVASQRLTVRPKGSPPCRSLLGEDVLLKGARVYPPQGDNGVNARTSKPDESLRIPQTQKMIPDSRRELN